METPDEVRASEVGRYLKCPGSQLPGGPKIDTPRSRARDVGQATHEALASWLEGGGLAYEAAATKRGLNAGQAKTTRIYSYMGRNLWREVQPWVRVLDVERELRSTFEFDVGSITLTGHADVIGEVLEVVEPTLLVWDWKTGRKTPPKDQLRTYALLALREWDEFERALITTAWIREKEYEWQKLSVGDFADFTGRLRWAVANPDTYNPGSQCRYCRKRYECEARRNMLSYVASVLAGAHDEDIDEPGPDRLAELYPSVEQLEDAIDDYDDSIEALVEERGPMPTGDGTEVYLQSRSRTGINLTDDALRVLADVFECDPDFPEDVLYELWENGAIKTSKGKLMDAVADTAERGNKGDKCDEVLEALKREGAVSVSSFSFPSTREVQDEQE